MTDTRAWRGAILLTVLLGGVRLMVALAVPLFPDETYYWEWSRHLAAGYFDHPPGIAWVIRAGTLLLGDTVLGVRGLGIIAGLLASLVVVVHAGRVGGGRAALVAAVLIGCMPLSAAGLILATPDVLLMLSAAVAFWAVTEAISLDDERTVELGWWLVAGVATGLAVLSKLNGLLIPLGVAVAFVPYPQLRRRLMSPGPWVATGVALAVSTPFLLWNFRHDWVTFGFQLRHGLGGQDGSMWLRQLELLGGQLGLVSPIVFCLVAWACFAALRSPDLRRSALATTSLATFGVFVLGALRAPTEPNWPAIAYVPAIVVLATADRSPLRRRWLPWGVAVGVVMVIGLYVQAILPWLPVPGTRDPVAHAHGWHQVAAVVSREAEELSANSDRCPAVWVEARTYQHASEVAFHSTGTPYIHANNLMSRPNQYDFWSGFADGGTAGDCLLLFGRDPGTTEAIEVLAPSFRSVEAAPRLLRKRRADVAEEIHVWKLVGWSGDPTPFGPGLQDGSTQ